MSQIAPYSAAAVQAGLALSTPSIPNRKPCPARRLVLASIEFDEATAELNDAQADLINADLHAPQSIQIFGRTFVVEPCGFVMEVSRG